MKRTCLNIFILLGLFFLPEMGSAQCPGVSVEAYPRNPQSGMFNYYGVKILLVATCSQNVTVSGYIHASSDPNPTVNGKPFSFTVNSGSVQFDSGDGFYQMGLFDDASVTITSVSPCPSFEVTASYAGVSITYEQVSGRLRFSSINDLNTVIDQLDAAYENHNDAYESAHPGLTPDQLDDVDDLTGFDEFQPLRAFENLFSGFVSQRKALENIENAWLNNNYGGTDPDDVDLTFDDELNTVFNNNNTFKIGNDVYQLTAAGIYVNGNLMASAEPLNRNRDGQLAATNHITKPAVGLLVRDFDVCTDCKTNRKKVASQDIGNERFKLKIAIHWSVVRSSGKSKVVHFKIKNNGKPKRRRANMAVYLGGKVYDASCSESLTINPRKPGSGFKNRKSLKLKHTVWFPYVLKTYSGELGAGFETSSGQSGTLALTW